MVNPCEFTPNLEIDSFLLKLSGNISNLNCFWTFGIHPASGKNKNPQYVVPTYSTHLCQRYIVPSRFLWPRHCAPSSTYLLSHSTLNQFKKNMFFSQVTSLTPPQKKKNIEIWGWCHPQTTSSVSTEIPCGKFGKKPPPWTCRFSLLEAHGGTLEVPYRSNRPMGEFSW